MKKRMMLLLAIIIALLLCVCASAAEPRVHTVVPSLTFDGTTANCSAAITEAGSYIDATMTLWMGNRVIESWQESGTGAVLISGSCNVTKGASYTLRITGTIGGVPISNASISGTC